MKTASSSSTTIDGSEPRNAVFLLAAIRAFLVSFPPLVLSVTENSGNDAGLKLIFPARESQLLSTPGLAKSLNEVVLWSVAALALGYYRIYVDGPGSQRLLLILGGVEMLGASGLMISWCLQGHATPLLVAAGILPDSGFGIFFLKTWWSLPVKRAPPSPPKDAETTSSRRALPRHWVLGLAAAHQLLLALPALVLSVAGRRGTFVDVGDSLMLSPDDQASILAPGVTRDLFRMLHWLMFCCAAGYCRLYLDGASQHPLFVLVGAAIKLGAASLRLSGYLQGITRSGVVYFEVLPDLLFSGYLLKVWLEMGCILAPPATKQHER